MTTINIRVPSPNWSSNPPPDDRPRPPADVDHAGDRVQWPHNPEVCRVLAHLWLMIERQDGP